jgi:PAS domain S-box-containing protein
MVGSAAAGRRDAAFRILEAAFSATGRGEVAMPRFSAKRKEQDGPRDSDPGAGAFETLVRSIDGIVWEADAKTFRFTYVSPQAERILGYPASQWLEDPDFWVSHVLPDDREWAMSYCLRATQEKRDHQFEYRMVHADGSAVWLRDIVTVVVEDDRPVKLRGVMVDVTEQKEIEDELRHARGQMEIRVRERTSELARANEELLRKIDERAAADRALRESEARFRTLAENIRQVFWMSTPGVEEMVYVSPAYEEIWGRPLAGVMSDPLAWTEPIHPEDRPRVMRELDEHRQGRFEVEYRIIRPDGSIRRILDRGFPVHDDEGRLIYMTGIAEDITERKGAEETKRMRDLAAHLQSAREEERKRIAREIHDELGQVLTGLKLEVGWAAKRVLNDPSRVRNRLTQMHGMIDGAMAALRKITADLRPDALDLGLVNAIRWQADEFKRRASIVCTLELPEDDVGLDTERSTAMFRIFQEALTNVARHAGASAVRVSLSERSHQVVLEVADDGRGITGAQAANARSFGLLGMQERARLAGGTVTVTGEPGRGTTVTAQLPVSSAPRP